MLRLHFLQQWVGYSDLALEETLNDVPPLSVFAGLEVLPVGGRWDAGPIAAVLALRPLHDGALLDRPTGGSAVSREVLLREFHNLRQFPSEAFTYR